MWAGFRGALPKKAICPCCVFSIQCGTNILEPQVKAMLLNYADADLFNSHVSCGNKGIHHKHLICILHGERARFASLSHQTMFITLIILQYSDEHFHHLTPSESSIAEPLMSATYHQLIEHSSGKKASAWNRGLGAAWILTIERWRGIETVEGTALVRLEMETINIA